MGRFGVQGIESLNMEMRLRGWGVVQPGGTGAEIDACACVAFSGEDVCQESVAAAENADTYEDTYTYTSKDNDTHPRSKNPPGGRGHAFHGSFARYSPGCWEVASSVVDVLNVSFQSNIMYVAMPISYMEFVRFHVTREEKGRNAPQKHASEDPSPPATYPPNACASPSSQDTDPGTPPAEQDNHA